MRHRADIQRDAGSGGDDWGGQGAQNWQDHLAAQPCYAWFAQGRRVVGAGTDVVVEDLRLLLPLSADVQPSDRIAAISDKRGNVIVAGPLVIDTVARRRDHQVAFLKEVA
jgi:hypothetical protein